MLQFIATIAILVAILSSPKAKETKPAAQQPSVSKAPTLSPMEEEELRKQRKRFDDEMEAFQEMLNYNADVAYGINKETK